MIKIFLHVVMLKRKRNDYNNDFKKSIIKILRITLLLMFINKNLKILRELITKNVLVFLVCSLKSASDNMIYR